MGRDRPDDSLTTPRPGRDRGFPALTGWGSVSQPTAPEMSPRLSYVQLRRQKKRKKRQGTLAARIVSFAAFGRPGRAGLPQDGHCHARVLRLRGTRAGARRQSTSCWTGTTYRSRTQGDVRRGSHLYSSWNGGTCPTRSRRSPFGDERPVLRTMFFTARSSGSRARPWVAGPSPGVEGAVQEILPGWRGPSRWAGGQALRLRLGLVFARNPLSGQRADAPLGIAGRGCCVPAGRALPRVRDLPSPSRGEGRPIRSVMPRVHAHDWRPVAGSCTGVPGQRPRRRKGEGRTSVRPRVPWKR